MISFCVYGHPEPGGSKRAVPIGGGRLRAIDANPRAKGWKDRVAQAVGEQLGDSHALFRGPLEVELTFYRSRPKNQLGSGRNAGQVKSSAPAYPTTRPDALKLARLVEDSLVHVLYEDDAQIVIERLHKCYGEPERVEIKVSPLRATVGAEEVEQAA